MVRGVPLRASTRSICCCPSHTCEMRELAMAPDAESTTNVPVYERLQGALCMRSIHWTTSRCRCVPAAPGVFGTTGLLASGAASAAQVDAVQPSSRLAHSSLRQGITGFPTGSVTAAFFIAQARRQIRSCVSQRPVVSKVALRKNPAGICRAEVLPNCLWAASNSSRRGSRIMICWPSASATATTGVTGAADRSVATASCAPDAPGVCRVANALQPIAATAASEANPAAIFHRKTDALAA